LVTVHTGAETFEGRKLFKGGNYLQKYGRFNVMSQYFHQNIPSASNKSSELLHSSTPMAEMFGGSDFWLETRVIIKISTHPC
jgi:hypothetical protein